ncbi:MAG: tRNA epoxyqueuosine(34) reductase QueG [Pseudomonadota bacterium]|jgi:epoxyqueuosine reductase
MVRLAKPHPLLDKQLRKAGLPWSSVFSTEEWASAWAQQTAPEELKNDLEFLAAWLVNGQQAGMHFLTKNKQARRDARLIFPQVSSILSVIIPYATGRSTRGTDSTNTPAESAPNPIGTSLYSKTARYARVPDYHKVIRKELDLALRRWQADALDLGLLQQEQPWRVVTDSLPFLDRAHARIARLGFIGKNTMLIRPGVGSYFFIAHVLLSTPFSLAADPGEDKPVGANAIAELSCGDCRKCIDACPTQALIAPHRLDANKCLSYLTIEHRDIVEEKYLKNFSDNFYGCDICQDACPYNYKTAGLTTLQSFQAPLKSLLQVTVEDVAQMTQQQYESWFGGTAMTRAKYSGLVRNAIYSLYADRSPVLTNILEKRKEDPDPLIRATIHQISSLNKD